jgi:hypothetical protein
MQEADDHADRQTGGDEHEIEREDDAHDQSSTSQS